jgi:hypothetical protein
MRNCHVARIGAQIREVEVMISACFESAAAVRNVASRIGAFLFVVAAVLGSDTAAQAADDPYLKALQSEAGKVEDLTKAQAEQRRVQEAMTKQPAAPAPAARPVSAAPAAPVSAGSRGDMEKVLRDQFPGTFALYLKFSEADKLLVVREYEASKAAGIARYLPVINQVVQVSVARY